MLAVLRGGVIRTITVDTDNLTEVTEGFNKNLFVLQGGPGQDLQAGDDLDALVVIESLEERTFHDDTSSGVGTALLDREIVGVFPIDLGFVNGGLSRVLFLGCVLVLIRCIHAGPVVLGIANKFCVDTDRAVCCLPKVGKSERLCHHQVGGPPERASVVKGV